MMKPGDEIAQGIKQTTSEAFVTADRPGRLVSIRWRDGSSRALMASFCTAERDAIVVGPVATGSECDAFRWWVDGLAIEGHEALQQLRQYGFTDDLAALRAQLTHALRSTHAGPLCRCVGWRLLDLLSKLPRAVCFFLEENAYAR